MVRAQLARRDEESLLRNRTRIAVDRLYVLRVWRASKSHELLFCVSGTVGKTGVSGGVGAGFDGGSLPGIIGRAV